MAIHLIPWQELPPATCRGGAVSIGNFDGVHRGHAALLAELRRHASAIRGPAVVLTFEPHPLQLLRPDQFMPVLTTLDDRTENLQAAGVDHVVVLRTEFDLLQLSASEFFERIILDHLGVRALVEGFNFGFGRNREGNVDTLAALCHKHQLRLEVVPPLHMAGVPVSSSRVRDNLLRGDIRDAAELLGRPYRLRGRVGTGQQRGQTLGFPTANLTELQTVVPGNGVYAVRAEVGSGTWPGAANIGPNPTFGENARKVEVHLIGFQGDLYNRELAVDFIARLRDTRPFNGPADLVAQLRKDVAEARRIAAPS
jgi:riboflavin kinase/FMN adenylyltransferase